MSVSILRKIARKINDRYHGVVDIEIARQKGSVYVINHTEVLREERQILSDIDAYLAKDGHHLKYECPGRYIIIR